MDNVVVTPHLAGSTQERVDRAIVFSFENARRVVNGQKPLNAVQIQD
jgi:phosphoglycerate dehydrogenase-like enzyme